MALFSKCFGGFCESFFGSSQSRFEGFLDMLSKAPTIFGVSDGQHVKYELDMVELHLTRAGDGLVICIGLTRGTFGNEVIEGLLTSIATAVKQFGQDKLVESEEEYTSLTTELLQHVPHLEGKPWSMPSCPLTTPKTGRSKFWESLREKYNLNMEVRE